MTDPVDRWSWHCKQQIKTLLEESESFNDVDVMSNVESFMFEMINEFESDPDHISELLSDVSLSVGPDAYEMLSDVLLKLQTYLSELNDRAGAITIQGPAKPGHKVSATLEKYHAEHPDNVPERFQKM
jgi:hypothetical protein